MGTATWRAGLSLPWHQGIEIDWARVRREPLTRWHEFLRCDWAGSTLTQRIAQTQSSADPVVWHQGVFEAERSGQRYFREKAAQDLALSDGRLIRLKRPGIRRSRAGDVQQQRHQQRQDASNHCHGPKLTPGQGNSWASKTHKA